MVRHVVRPLLGGGLRGGHPDRRRGHVQRARRSRHSRPRIVRGPGDAFGALGSRGAIRREALRERQKTRDWMESVITLDNPEVLAELERACDDNLRQVEDEGTRDRLKARYRFGSKRGLISSDWYPAFNRPNVELVTDRVEMVTPTGIVAGDGVERPADIIVLATGFKTTKFLSAIRVTGRDSVSLGDAWHGGVRAYMGMTVPGFPNMFMLYGPSTNNGSIIQQLESQVNYIIGKISAMARDGVRSLEIGKPGFEAYNAALQRDLSRVASWQGGVNDYYRDASGLIVTQWPHTMARYEAETLRDDMAEYVLSRDSAP